VDSIQDIEPKEHDKHELQVQFSELKAKFITIQDQSKALNAQNDKLQNLVHEQENDIQKKSRKLDRILVQQNTQKEIPVEEEAVKVQTPKQPVDENYEDIILLAESRLQEIQELVKQKQIKEKEIIFVKSTNEESEIIKQLQQQAILKNELEQALKENCRLLEERREFEEDVVKREQKKRKLIESDLKKFDQDIQRIRQQRDQFQQQLLKPVGPPQVDQPQTKLIALELELKRLKITTAGDAGELGLLRFFFENDFTQNPYKILEKQLAEKEQELLRYRSDPSETDGNSNEMELAEYKELYGELKQPMELAETITKLQQAEIKLERYQKVILINKAELVLITEVSNLGKAWATLEEEQKQHQQQMHEKNDLIQKIGYEKNKLEQKINLINKQTNSTNNLVLAHKRQSEKQLEQIRKSEELEKTLTQQLSCLEKINSGFEVLLFNEQRKIADLHVDIAKLKDIIQVLEQNSENVLKIN
jgi:hypothetical protein